MSTSVFYESNIKSAIHNIRKIINNQKELYLIEDINHSYNDKYIVCEYLTNACLSSILCSLRYIGLNNSIILSIKQQKNTSIPILLSFKSEETCNFIKTKQIKISPYQTQYLWKYTLNYNLNIQIYNKNINILSNTISHKLLTSSNINPRSKCSILDNIELNIDFLLSNYNIKDKIFTFKIDKTCKSCKTPSNNKNIKQALLFFNEYKIWCYNIISYFTDNIFNIDYSIKHQTSEYLNTSIMNPVLPILEQDNSTNTFNIPNINTYLNEQDNDINNIFNRFKECEISNTFIRYNEKCLLVILSYTRKLCDFHLEGIQYVESLLYTQFIQVIGNEVSELHMWNYQNYHCNFYFKDKYQHKSFCYPIRRNNYSPEGFIEIERKGFNIQKTFKRFYKNSRNIQFPINSNIKIHGIGNKYLHCWINQCYSTNNNLNFNLQVRTKQFSCFILLLGTLISDSEFNPTNAIILKNRDNLLIPLLFQQIPSPKEFKDAIESLSPEQQRFATSFRKMQLDSTLFSICVIQIKPQLEKILNLSNGSLTKEIELTNDLITLFSKYQIPSDLLDVSDCDNLSDTKKLEIVKKNVYNINLMINNEKEEIRKEVLKKEEIEIMSKYKLSNIENIKPLTNLLKDDKLSDYSSTKVTYHSKSNIALFTYYNNSKNWKYEQIQGKCYIEIGNNNEIKIFSDEGLELFEYKFTKTLSFQKPKTFIILLPSYYCTYCLAFFKKRDAKEISKILQIHSEHSIYSSSLVIGKPTNFQHNSHIGWDIDKGLTGVPKQWKCLLNCTGIVGQEIASNTQVLEVLNFQSNIEQNNQNIQSNNEQNNEIESSSDNIKRYSECIEDSICSFPKVLDNIFSKNKSLSLHSIIIKPHNTWNLYQKDLIGKETNINLSKDDLRTERNSTFDLLDSLTKSGLIDINEGIELHIITSINHNFDKTLINTIIQDNINPIQQLEESYILLSKVLYNTSEAINHTKVQN